MTDFIHFTHEDFDRLRGNYESWWNGTLKRPITSVIVGGYPTKKETKKPWLSTMTAWDTSIPVTDFLENHEVYLDTVRFHGEAFPSLYLSDTRRGNRKRGAILSAIHQ